LIPEHTQVTVQIPDRESSDCRAVSAVLARVGDKWSVLIIMLLGDGTKRFNAARFGARRTGEANDLSDHPAARRV
jgi:hypothetical protein